MTFKSIKYLIVLLFFYETFCVRVDAFAFTISGKKDTIRLGLLIPSHDALAAKYGAEMAVRNINSGGGIKGAYVRLIVRSMEGAWGAGASEAVNLVFNDKVTAIVGSCDGRNSHLIEQAATKSGVVFLSAWSGDPTLSQAFVPWFFNCSPNYNQQTSVLTEEIYMKGNFSRVITVTDEDYDSKSAFDCFIRKVKADNLVAPLNLKFYNSQAELSKLKDQIQRPGSTGLVLFMKPQNAKILLGKIIQKKPNLPDFSIFGMLNMMDENELTMDDLRLFENMNVISSGHWMNPETNEFKTDFRKLYGYLPGNVATYAYDGILTIVTALKLGGIEREMIQKSLSEIYINGKTGSFEFDSNGNRIGKISLLKVKNGTFTEINR